MSRRHDRDQSRAKLRQTGLRPMEFASRLQTFC
jgi:hypothetical protein